MIFVEARNLKRLAELFDAAPDKARKAGALAINKVVQDKAIPSLRTNIRTQVAFPEGYLEDPRRLFVKKRAVDGDLEGIVEGRGRATSLARFALNRTAIGRRPAGVPLRIQVSPGSTKTIRRGFLIRLPAGKGKDESAFNIGLAVRVPAGGRVFNKTVMARDFGGGLYLLYGPSVEQAFESSAVEETPGIADELENEFVAQFNRATGLTI